MKKSQFGNIALELIFVIVLVIFSLIAAVLAMYFSDESSAIKAAQDFGYTEVRVVSVHRFLMSDMNGCDDWKTTKMTGKNSLGKDVSFKICEGLFFKGATVRQ